MASTVVFVTLALLAAASAAPERVVGGEPTTIENYPYIVALVYTYPGPGITIQRCVGCLLSSYHVLTSAYCFTGAIPENMKIRAGSTNSLSGGQLVALSRFVKHPEYMETPRTADISVVTVESPLPISSTVGVLYLPPYNTIIPDGTETTIVSWGFEYVGGPQFEILKVINLNKIGMVECQDRYAGFEDEVTIDERVICATAPGKGICYGDSGAPMMIDQTVIGISAFEISCDDDDLADIFTRVDHYTPWILEVATAPIRGAQPRVAKF